MLETVEVTAMQYRVFNGLELSGDEIEAALRVYVMPGGDVLTSPEFKTLKDRLNAEAARLNEPGVSDSEAVQYIMNVAGGLLQRV